MTLDELETRMFNLATGLAATNLAIDAIAAAMPPESHARLLSAWGALRADFEQKLQIAASPQTIAATVSAMDQKEERLVFAGERFRGQ